MAFLNSLRATSWSDMVEPQDLVEVADIDHNPLEKKHMLEQTSNNICAVL